MRTVVACGVGRLKCMPMHSFLTMLPRMFSNFRCVFSPCQVVQVVDNSFHLEDDSVFGGAYNNAIFTTIMFLLHVVL